MSSTKVINLGNTCSTFGFIPENTAPTTTGGYYIDSSNGRYLFMDDGYYNSYVDVNIVTIPYAKNFSYNKFNIGLMYSSNIPAISYGGVNYTAGDPRLRVLTSYYTENTSGVTKVSVLSNTFWTIVALSTPATPSSSSFTVIRVASIFGSGYFTGITNGMIFNTTAISPKPSTAVSLGPYKSYVTYYNPVGWVANAAVAKNILSYSSTGSAVAIDLNTSLTPNSDSLNFYTTVTYSVSAAGVFSFSSSRSAGGDILGISGPQSDTSAGGSIDYPLNSVFTNILIKSFALTNGSTTGNPSSVQIGTSGGTTYYLSSTLPTADPDPAFTAASENGIIFIPSSPSVTGFTNPVLGVTPSTSSFAISSYFSLNPTATTPSFGYFLTYPLNYEEANPTIEAGSDFLLLTPDNAYIVYVNSSGALAIQPSNRLTSPGASPNITFQTFGGYWKATAVAAGSPGARGFQLSYVTPSTSYFVKHVQGTVSTDTAVANASTYTCMHCSPAAGTFICQPGV